MPRKRRANGDGSIYPVERIVNGRTYSYWVAEIQWRDEHDRVQKKSIQRKNEHLAREALDRLKGEIRDGRAVTGDRAKITVSQVLGKWLEDRRGRLRPNTIRSYNLVITQYLDPLLGRKRAVSLRRSDVDSLLCELQARNTGKRTMQLTYTVLKAALAPHVAFVDPAVHPFPRRSAPATEHREMTVWNEDEVRRFLNAAKADRYYALYALALSTGMRQGELLGLRWADVYPDHVVVRASFDQRERKLGPTKTLGSRRRIDIPSSVYEALQSLRARMEASISQEAKKSPAGASRGKNGTTSTRAESLVFQSEDGTAVHASNLHRRSFQKIMERADVSRIRFHDLRHTAATLMLGRGVHPKVVQERLGHRSIRLTLDTYSHVLPTMQQQAVAAVADLFGGGDSMTISPTSANMIESSAAERQQFQGFLESPSRKSA